MGDTPVKSATTAREAREKRLKEALRANLQRRKGQSRGRRTSETEEAPTPSNPDKNEAESS